MAINLKDTTTKSIKQNIIAFPAVSDNNLNSGYGILLFDANNVNVSCNIKDIRAKLLDNTVSGAKVSLHANDGFNYFTIAKNIPINSGGLYNGQTVSLIEESTAIWLSNAPLFPGAGEIQNLYAEVNSVGKGKTHFEVDYELFWQNSTNPPTLNHNQRYVQSTIDLSTPSTYTLDLFESQKVSGSYSWSLSGTTSNISPTSGTVTFTNGHGSIDFTVGSVTSTETCTFATSGNEFTSTLNLVYVAELYSMTDVYFTVCQALVNTATNTSHQTGPTLAEVQSWMTGTSNGGQGYTWASNTSYLDVPVQGYQRWQVPATGTYRIRAKGARAGYTDSYSTTTEPSNTVQADFSLTMGDYLIIAVGQGVPVYSGDHCNGGAGATWVAKGSNISTSECLLVAAGGPAGTSDGSAKADPPTSLSRSVNVSGAVGTETDGINVTTYGGNSANTGGARSGSWLANGSNTNTQNGGGFRTSNLVGGNYSNNTAGNGGFGGGSGGFDEQGAGSGGFSGSYGTDNTALNGVGTSFIASSGTNASCTLSDTSTSFQSTDWKSESQFQGMVKITKLP